MIAVSLIVFAALYAYGVRRASQRKLAPKPLAIAAFALGLIVTGFVLLGPMDELSDTSLSWHMVQHLALGFIVAPLLLLGAPIRLALAASPAGGATRLAALFGSTPMRLLTHPACALLQFTAVLYAVHFTPLYEAALEHEPIHAFEHVLLLGSALIFWTPILAVAPAPHAPAHAVRLLMLFLALPMSAFLGFILYVMRLPLYAHYATIPGALADQQNAGAVMWIAGGGPVFIALLWCVADWGARERRLGLIADRAGCDVVMSMLLLAATLALGAPANASGDNGRRLYTQNCSACHGADLRGGPNAPTLIGVGAAGADFWISTGRMPAAVPWLQVAHRGLQPYLSPSDETAIVAYVAAASPGPPIPVVMTGGDTTRGHLLFQQNCQHCHGVDGNGGSIGGTTWAPSLANATVTQVAEAIRVGPGEMPQFGDTQIDQTDLNDIATYLSAQRGAGTFTGLPIAAGGTVPEGMYGWIAAGILSFFGFGFWSLDRKPPKGPDDAP